MFQITILLFLVLITSNPVNADIDIYKFIEPATGMIYYSNESKEGYTLIRSSSRTYQKLTKNQKRLIEKRVKENLFDPYSAHFKWPQKAINLEDGILGYCFFVNAKNRFGGYVGYKQHSVLLAKAEKGWEVKEQSGAQDYCSNSEDLEEK